MPMAPGQFAGESTGPPSLPAETTTSTPMEASVLMIFALALSQVPWPPRLTLMILAGVGLAGTPGTVRPAAQFSAGDHVRVEAAALAEHAHRQNPPPR